jgi:hypothetical protein
MSLLHLISYFFGGAVLMNAVPHITNGISGRPFQSPFATPRGKGLSSSTLNMWWGCFNLAVGYLLICKIGTFNIDNLADAGSAGLGALIIGVLMARHFGAFHGGNDPQGKS